MSGYRLEKNILISYKNEKDEIEEKIIEKDFCIESIDEVIEEKDTIILERGISFINSDSKERIIFEKGDKVKIYKFEEEYNGWKNFETYTVVGLADNDYDIYKAKLSLQKKIKRWDKNSVEKFIKGNFSNKLPDFKGIEFNKVDWQEIADSWNEDLKESQFKTFKNKKEALKYIDDSKLSDSDKDLAKNQIEKAGIAKIKDDIFAVDESGILESKDNIKENKEGYYYKAVIHVDVYEDSYDDGEGDNVNSYILDTIEDKSFKNLITSLEKVVGSKKEWEVSRMNNYSWASEISTSQLQNGNGNIASRSEISEWQKGIIKLYNAHFHILVSRVGESPATSSDFASVGLKLYERKIGSSTHLL